MSNEAGRMDRKPKSRNGSVEVEAEMATSMPMLRRNKKIKGSSVVSPLRSVTVTEFQGSYGSYALQALFRHRDGFLHTSGKL